MRNTQNWISGSLIFVVIISLGGCGRERTRDLGEFEPYVAAFEDLAQRHGRDIHIYDLVVKFGEMHHDLERGSCEIRSSQAPTITIRKDTWESMSEEEQQELIFHELGHCVLARSHRDDVSPQGIPMSIMNSFMIPQPIYQYNQDYYLRELFKEQSAPM